MIRIGLASQRQSFTVILTQNLNRGLNPSFSEIAERNQLVKCLVCVDTFKASNDLDGALEDAESVNALLSSLLGIEDGYLILSELFFRLGAFPQSAQCLSRILENQDASPNKKALAGVLASKVEGAMQHTDAGIRLAKQSVGNAKVLGDSDVECDALECFSEALEQEGERLLDQSVVELDSAKSGELQTLAHQQFQLALTEISKGKNRLTQAKVKDKPLQLFSMILQAGELHIKLADFLEGKRCK